MKTKQLIISTIFTLIASYPVSAETENFDMALTGDFQNEECARIYLHTITSGCTLELQKTFYPVELVLNKSKVSPSC